ncbi:ankyrin repeat ph and sec7 domain containing protein secg-related [Anaeramoeba flamelloides]|uniref:Ankyrin repeat ph and sec7 domain containing protein secg-related n=1 Tax=Anaeramoeba flamelloides TaxID=1746091 RepID=A0AAV8A431_9EUKA|nr:ankyrin repeat ph and sec7 domain containing protein secg-related [Anaeramoeba flamelloides]
MTTEVRSNNELVEAIKNNDLETFKKLCTTDTKNIIIVDQFHRYATNRFNVLQWACYLGNPSIEMMQYFLDEGIDVNDGKIGSALAFLCLGGTAKLDAVKFLVENGANVKKQKLEFYIDGYYAYYGIETDQATPLQLLLYRQKSKENLLEMCQFLIQSNCPLDSEAFLRERQERDTDSYDSDDRTTTNTLGVYCCNSNSQAIDPKVFKLLLANKQDPNQLINEENKYKNKTIHHCSILQKLIQKHQLKLDLLQIVYPFLIYEADPKIKDEKGKTAFDYLQTETINYEVLQNLLKGNYGPALFEKEFQTLWQNKECTDFEIYGIKCHKQLIEVRTKQDPQEVKTNLEKEYSKNISENVLKWVYGEKYTDELFDPTVVNHLQIKDVLQNSMAKSWEEAYFDESKKDFTLSVSWKFDPEEEEEEEEEEAEIVQIKIHKTLLIARLGLFREMFTKLEKEEEIINQVTDHSGMRVDTMTIFVAFLYKNKIETSGDYELIPKVLKEISELPHYFKMNDNSKICLETALHL